ncbi:uncharacterized protein LY89DRAFT_239218 [Mollisia scopiformis]|uniref:DUF7730 domain-containing protein n=1 Tax=Mollisia scopiformis TaxID=149040 RepID=A0A194WT96_MOLSC|nr:uncharacterized protein LY89DRAFT_239218 [Mollisia scopiformis]KUJ11183.1 hypothetical protein LY89DRAFT_239218 [Mollisia scopiformis]
MPPKTEIIRRRALSAIFRREVYSGDESQSRLLRLPFELRNKIWEYCFTYPNGIPIDCQIQNDRRFKRKGSPWPGASVLALLFTCRQVYVETIDMTWRACQFRTDAISVLHLESVVIPRRRDAIVNLSVQWDYHVNKAPASREQWIKVWEALSRLKSLKTLRVLVIGGWPVNTWRREREVLFEDMRKVEGLESFDFSLQAYTHGCRLDVPWKDGHWLD